MKKIIKSLLLLALVGFTTVRATQAYFFSTVSANENVIEAGTLLLGLASTANLTSSGPAYYLAYDRLLDAGGVWNDKAEFPALENLYPGESREVYLSVFNRGTLPLNFRFSFDGDWTKLPNYATDIGSKNMVKITEVKRFAHNNWEGEYGPYNIKNWLEPSFAWDNEATSYNGWTTGWNVDFPTGADLEPMQFQVFKVTFTLDADATNAYQGGTFEYEITAEAKQTNDTTTW